jgi:hypothetical protein
MKLPTSGIITSVDLDLDPTGIQDCAPVLQAAIDGLTAPACFLFTPGLFRFGFPVLMGQYAPALHGAGRDLTILQTFPGYTHPIAVYGFRNIEQGGAQVTAANRPDCLGVLDRSFTSAPGYACGFRTCSNVYAVGMNHPIAIGSRSSKFGGVCWSYWDEDPGFTLELAITFSGAPQAGPILGLGSASSRPSPWFLSVVDAHTFAFGFKTNDMSPDWSTGQHYLTFSIPSTTTPWKLRIWIDWTTGTIGASCNGRPLAITWSGPAPALAGLRFQRNRGQFAFFLGTDQDSAGVNGVKVPDFTLWGLRLSNIARTTEPANDGARYLDDAHTIAFLPGYGPPARYLTLRAGQAGYQDMNAFWLIPATPMLHGVPGGSVEDLTFQDGSLLLGRVLNFAVRHCKLFGRYCGIHTLPAMEASYPVILDDVMVSGGDACVSLQKCEVWANSLVLQQGGITGYRGIGGNNRLRNTFLAFPGINAETAIELLPEQWGAMDEIDGFNCDNEVTSFSHAIIRKELSPYTSSSLRARDLNLSTVPAIQPVIDLVGHPLSPGTYNPGVVDVRVVGIYSQGHGPVVNAGVNWTGTVSVTNLSGPIVTGVSAPAIRVESATPIQPQETLMAPNQDQGNRFPTCFKQLVEAPPETASVLDNLETVFTDLQSKFGQINWLQLIMTIAPFLATKDFAGMFAAIIANLGKIFAGTTPAPQHVEAALRQYPMFRTV